MPNPENKMSNFSGGFTGGVSIRGMPILNAYPGQVLWVDSNGSVNSSYGTYQRPFASIAAALSQANASKGDIIMCKAGHVEPVISAAGTLTIATAGVCIIGLGVGNNRPNISFSTSTAATLLVTAAQVSIVNCVIDLTGIDALVGPIAVQAADFAMIGCDVITANASGQATLGILTTAAADRMLIDGCRFRGTTDAGTTAAIRCVGGDSVTIQNSTFTGAYGAGNGAIENITTGMTNYLIDNCRINNQTASSTKGIVMAAGSTGIFSNNRIGILSGVAPVTSAAGTNGGGNYYSAAAGVAAGTLL